MPSDATIQIFSFWQKFLLSLFGFAVTVILLLIGFGVNSIHTDIHRVEINQVEIKKDFAASQGAQDALIKQLCETVSKHENWLKVPYDLRKRYFLGLDDNGKNKGD